MSDTNIIFKHKTPLVSHLLSKLLYGVVEEGWISEPTISINGDVLSLSDLSFYYKGRYVNVGIDASVDTEYADRVFHISVKEPFLLPLDFSQPYRYPLALGFNYRYVPGVETSVDPSVLFDVLTQENIDFSFNGEYPGLILGRFYFSDDQWHFTTDGSSFTKKYLEDNGLSSDYRVASGSITKSASFDATLFFLKNGNNIIRERQGLVQGFPSGHYIPVVLNSGDGVCLLNPIEGHYYAIGFPSVVTDGVDTVSLVVLGEGSDISDAINSCIKQEVDGVRTVSCFHPPIAVVRYSVSLCIVIPFNKSLPAFFSGEQLNILNSKINNTLFNGKSDIITDQWGVARDLQVNLGRDVPTLIDGSDNSNNTDIGVVGILPVLNGGTGANSELQARINLGVMARNNPNITLSQLNQGDFLSSGVSEIYNINNLELNLDGAIVTECHGHVLIMNRSNNTNRLEQVLFLSFPSNREGVYFRFGQNINDLSNIPFRNISASTSVITVNLNLNNLHTLYPDGTYLLTGTLTNSPVTAWCWCKISSTGSGNSLRVIQEIWKDNDPNNMWVRLASVSNGVLVWREHRVSPALVTRGEAEEGVLTTVRGWTPQRVREAIEALSPKGSSIHSDQVIYLTRNNAEVELAEMYGGTWLRGSSSILLAPAIPAIPAIPESTWTEVANVIETNASGSVWYDVPSSVLGTIVSVSLSPLSTSGCWLSASLFIGGTFIESISSITGYGSFVSIIHGCCSIRVFLRNPPIPPSVNATVGATITVRYTRPFSPGVPAIPAFNAFPYYRHSL